MTDVERLLRTLAQGGVQFILVGGVAATAHGSARLTQDVDIVYSCSTDNLARLVSALAPHSPYLRGAPRPACPSGGTRRPSAGGSISPSPLPSATSICWES